VHLERADGGDKDGDIGLEAAEAALDVPEFLETDVGGKAGLCDMVVEELEGQAVAEMEDCPMAIFANGPACTKQG
jgi:hypothetical protein